LDWVHGVSADDYLQSHLGISPQKLTDYRFAAGLAPGRVVLARIGSAVPTQALLFANPEQEQNLGFIDLLAAADNTRRHAAIYSREAGGLAPSFPALLALRQQGRSPADPGALEALASSERLTGTPPRRIGQAWINYFGPPRATFRRIPAEALETGTLRPEERAALQGALLLIGPTYIGSDDRHRGPSGQLYDGVELHAHAIATLLDGRPLRETPRWKRMMLAAVVATAGSLAAALLPAGWAAAALAALVALVSGASFAAFSADRLYPMGVPLIAAGTGWTGQLLLRAAEEAARRRKAERLFGQHVDRAVVDRLMQEAALVRVGGERRTITVLFSDLRGFTQITQELEAHEVTRLLNEYLGEMAAIIFRFGGTLDKYMGDGVMAFWNAPEPQPDHAYRAVCAAWEMSAALEGLNRHWKRTGADVVHSRIGINTGPAVVGSMGSEQRQSYTVIGHTVNVASRIERLNKELGTLVLIGEATFHEVVGRIGVREHPRVPVRGLAQPIAVFEVTSLEPSAPDGPAQEEAPAPQGWLARGLHTLRSVRLDDYTRMK
jgi:adenylate cyclase